jgi:hypothetical protein
MNMIINIRIYLCLPVYALLITVLLCQLHAAMPDPIPAASCARLCPLPSFPTLTPLSANMYSTAFLLSTIHHDDKKCQDNNLRISGECRKDSAHASMLWQCTRTYSERNNSLGTPGECRKDLAREVQVLHCSTHCLQPRLSGDSCRLCHSSWHNHRLRAFVQTRHTVGRNLSSQLPRTIFTG